VGSFILVLLFVSVFLAVLIRYFCLGMKMDADFLSFSEGINGNCVSISAGDFKTFFHGGWRWLVLALRLATERNLRDKPAHVDIYFAEKRNYSSNPLFYKACRGKNNLI